MSVEISVICLTYNSDLKKTLTTLNSVISQKYCSFELIIADDGSKVNQFNVIEEFFKARNFSNYKLQANETNNGIICNYLSAIELAQGKYIKYISPGDYLYNEYTLCNCIAFMQKHNAEFAFGKALYYSNANNNLAFLNKQDPVFTELYDADKDDYNYDEVLKYLVLYQDYVLGAAIITDRVLFKQYLLEIVGKVTYIEDNTILPLVTLDRKRIYYFNEYILWYECDSGISTNVNRGFKEKIDIDFLNSYKLLKQQHDSMYICIAYWRQRFEVNKDKILLSIVKRIVDLFYGRRKFRRIKTRKELNRFIEVFDVSNWYKWHEL